jgi:hypothetical protein
MKGFLSRRGGCGQWFGAKYDELVYLVGCHILLEEKTLTQQMKHHSVLEIFKF